MSRPEVQRQVVDWLRREAVKEWVRREFLTVPQRIAAELTNSYEGTVLAGERRSLLRKGVVSEPSAWLSCAGLPARMTRRARSTVPASAVVAR
jgi:hypothetical protein